MKSDSKQGYGTVSKVFHWSMAFLILWQLLKLADRIKEGEHWVSETLVPYHISIGFLIFLLVIPRIFWALKQRKNRPDYPTANAVLVKAGHTLLYLVMIFMPLTGISYMIGEGYGLKVFGLQLVAEGEKIPWMHNIGELHSPAAWLLLILIIGHVGIALMHHFIKKDDILRRML